VLDGTSFGYALYGQVGKDSRMREQQGSIEGWTTFVFLGLVVAAALGAAAARFPQLLGR
jgi:hypothetical protein